jgi:trichothecene 3-O-acetyltransferase
MAFPSIMRVRPSNWKTAPAEEQFMLSDMDHTMPKVYVLILEIFELQASIDRDDLVRNMEHGLEFALSQYPILAGVFHMDANTGRMFVNKKGDSDVALHVRSASQKEFPSFAHLSERDFPMHLIDGRHILPSFATEKQVFNPTGDNSDEQTPISVFQVTFIDGGVTLGMAIHHTVSDGSGCNGFLATWAEASRAAQDGTPFQPVDPANMDRSRLNAPKPSKARWQELDGKFPLFVDAGGPPPPPPADFELPNLMSCMWHFPKSRIEKLKREASAGAGAGQWISTYDAIMGILWQAITRAKLPMLKPELDRETVMVHGVNTRQKFVPPLPSRFIGNALALLRAGPKRIRDIIRNDSLPELASAVRASINTITPQYVVELPEWVAGLQDRRWITMNMNSYLGSKYLTHPTSAHWNPN